MIEKEGNNFMSNTFLAQARLELGFSFLRLPSVVLAGCAPVKAIKL